MWQKNARYLDYNAGAGLSDRVKQELQQCLEAPDFFAANPSSRHRLGQKLQSLLYLSTVKVAKSLGPLVTDDQILFTSSGTESNQTVIRSALAQSMQVFLSAGEHSASYDLMGGDATHEIPLLPTGQIDLGKFYNQLTSFLKGQKGRKILISLFWANNETGVLNPLDEVGELLKSLRQELPEHQYFLHLDGAQVWGKLPMDLLATPANWVTFSSHKIGAPAGTGVIWSREPQSLTPLMPGKQGHGLRGGTENWLGIFATGVAAETAANPEAVESFRNLTRSIRDRFEVGLLATGLPMTFWGAQAPRVTNTSRVSFDSFSSYENWVELLDLRGFAVSHGSACQSRTVEPSRVLLKMGASREAALNSIRVSFGPGSLVSDADELVAVLVELHQNKKNSKFAQRGTAVE